MSDINRSILDRLDIIEGRLDEMESIIADDFKYSRTKRDVDAIKEMIGIK